MNETIDVLLKHQSIRKYKEVPLTDEQIDAIISSAQMASTSSNLQAYSIIGCTDPALKQELAALAGNQPYVEQCGLFLVFCADLNRMKQAVEKNGKSYDHSLESFIIATTDATLAAQNAAVAAESLGLGICYIGGIRNNPGDVTRVLNLPKLVYPIFGLCIGVPDQDPGIKPRLPKAGLFHLNGYQSDQVKPGIDDYDRHFHDYFFERTGGKVDTNWSARLAEHYFEPGRKHMRPYLDEQGFKFD